MSQELLKHKGEILRADISIATSGANTIITGVAGQTIRIHRLMLYMNANNNITLKNGSTTLMGVMNFLANSGWEHDAESTCPIVLADGASFVINLSASSQVSGSVWYAQDLTLNS
jgi:hypothetical protein